MAVESTYRDNQPLLVKAVDKLEAMLESKSQKRQMQAIKLLLNLHDIEIPERPAPGHTTQERPSLIRLDPALQGKMKVKQS